MTKRHGALPAEWDYLSLNLGLAPDIIPVVSNPNAVISPDSKMKGLGKTPSKYHRTGKVVGIAAWTQHTSTLDEISAWQAQPDYGICVITRRVRAIDIDIEDPDIAQLVLDRLKGLALPMRIRANSSKCLLAFTYEGELPKRVIRLEKGIIELLGSGQQFIACGTHTSGARYEWITPDGDSGLPEDIPALTLDQINSLWADLEKTFAVAPSTSAAAPSKAAKMQEAFSNDPVAQHLIQNNHVKSTERDGRLHIVCPFEAEHTSESADSATTYFPANTGGYALGHFDCKHAHCAERTDDDFKAALGVPYADPLDDFDVIPEKGTVKPPLGSDIAHPEGLSTQNEAIKPKRFGIIRAVDFAVHKTAAWIIKGILPKAEVGVVYGESGSGKTFIVLDIVGAILRGEPWRGHRATKGKVVYICAEGASGMRSRLRAYSGRAGVGLDSLDLGIIPDAPNFMQVQDIKDLLGSFATFGSIDVIVVDTWAQVLAGANENAGEDVGKALAHCKAIHRRTGALVLLVHHAGKDASKGARGWSGLRAAADVEIEVTRSGDDRVATITKLKDGVDGAEFGFRLLTVPVGLDEDGEVMSSCVIEHTEVSKREAAKNAPKGSNEKLVLRVLGESLSADGVGYHDLLEASIAQMPFDTKLGKRDRRREVLSQAVEKLRESGLILVDGDKISLPVDNV